MIAEGNWPWFCLYRISFSGKEPGIYIARESSSTVTRFFPFHEKNAQMQQELNGKGGNSAVAPVLFQFPLAKLIPPYLSGQCLRQLGHKLDCPGILVWRSGIPDMGLDLLYQGFRRLDPWFEHNEGLDDHSPDKIRRSHDSRFLDCRVLQEGTLHLERTDSVPELLMMSSFLPTNQK